MLHAHTRSQHQVVKAHHYKFGIVHLSLFSSLHQMVTAIIQHILKSQSSSTLCLLARHWIASVRVDSFQSASMWEMHFEAWHSQTSRAFASPQRICLPSIPSIHPSVPAISEVSCKTLLIHQSTTTTSTPHPRCCLSVNLLLAESQEAFSYFYSYHKTHLISLII